MPNLYVTPQEIKTVAPEMLDASDTSQDDALYRLCERISRMIDRHTMRNFYPYSEQRVFDVAENVERVRIDDIISITTVEISRDHGSSYLASSDFGSSDYLTARGDRIDPLGSYDTLVINKNGAVGSFPAGQRSLRVDAVWSYADDRSDAWEDSTDEVEDDPLSDSATTLTVNDVDGAGLWGITPRIQVGHLLRIESEYAEVTDVTVGSDTATIVRGRNGTTAAAHAQNKQIDVWRPPNPIKQAATITAVKALQRAKQQYQDASANPDLGQMFFVQDIDPEAAVLLKPYMRKWVVG